jgi:SAM-dependent methyltransferase
MDQIISILRCPASGADLVWYSDTRIGTRDGNHMYEVKDGVYYLTVESGHHRGGSGGSASASAEKEAVRRFYDSYGWQRTDNGTYGDTSLFADRRSVSCELARRCVARIRKRLPTNGRFLLDAGSGAIPHGELLQLGRGFERRICVDLSAVALREAQAKLGTQGVYVLGDVCNLPIQDAAMDGVWCSHVLYHVPPNEQRTAFLELWRVVAPGGRAVVGYSWSGAPLGRAVDRVLSLLDRNGIATPLPAGRPRLYNHRHSRAWFEGQSWPFRYGLSSFQIVSSDTTRRRLDDGWLSRLAAASLLGFQAVFPSLSGRYGQYPVISFGKPQGL